MAKEWRNVRQLPGLEIPAFSLAVLKALEDGFAQVVPAPLTRDVIGVMASGGAGHVHRSADLTPSAALSALRAAARGAASDALQARAVADHCELFTLRARIPLVALHLGTLHLC